MIPELNDIILLNYVMNDTEPYQFEPEGTLQEEDDSKWLRSNAQEKL